MHELVDVYKRQGDEDGGEDAGDDRQRLGGVDVAGQFLRCALDLQLVRIAQKAGIDGIEGQAQLLDYSMAVGSGLVSALTAFIASLRLRRLHLRDNGHVDFPPHLLLQLQKIIQIPGGRLVRLGPCLLYTSPGTGVRRVWDKMAACDILSLFGVTICPIAARQEKERTK